MKTLKRQSIFVLPISVFILLGSSCSCLPQNDSQTLGPVNAYPYYEADIYDLPPLAKIEGILILNYNHPEVADIEMAIGNQSRIEEIAGREILPKKIVEDHAWVKRIVDDISDAQPRKWTSSSDARIVFLTKRKAYMVQFDTNDEEGIAYNDDFVSRQLWDDLHELGLVEPYKPQPFDLREMPRAPNH